MAGGGEEKGRMVKNGSRRMTVEAMWEEEEDKLNIILVFNKLSPTH